MEVQEFDDRRICASHDHPSYLVEQWSWDYAPTGEMRSLICATYTLTGCDVHQALAWAAEHQADPGCFVLHAGIWTNHGYLETLHLTGEAPSSTH
jgi:hypothetical protein